MADSTISQLPPTVSVNTTDVVPIDQGGVTKRATIAQIASAAAFAAGPPGPTGAIGISWLGTWNGVAPYPERAAVYYKGSSYIAKYANTGATPTDLVAWDYLSIGIPYGVNGIMKQDTSYNVSAAVPGVDYVVPGGVIFGLAGGSAGVIPYQIGTNTTAFTTAGTSGQFLQSNGAGAPSWASPGAASALSGGAAGAVVWQSGTGTTAFTTAGTSGQLLQSNGVSAPSWVVPGTLITGTSTAANYILGGSSGMVPYQSGTNTTAFTTAGTAGQLFQSNGTAAPSWFTPPSWALTTAVNTFTQQQVITSTAVSTAGTSGALQIAGGLGVQKTVYALNYYDLVVAKGNISNATVTFDVTAGGLQTFTATGSTATWAFSNWPTTGNLGVVIVAATNAGAFTLAFPTINWLLPAGTLTTTFATYLAGNGTRTALQSSGIDMFKFWSWDAGTTIYGQLI